MQQQGLAIEARPVLWLADLSLDGQSCAMFSRSLVRLSRLHYIDPRLVFFIPGTKASNSTNYFQLSAFDGHLC